MRAGFYRLMMLLAAGVAAHSYAAEQPNTAGSAATPTAAQLSFATPQQAASALIEAAGKFDVPALLGIFGPAAKDLVSSSDPIEDKNYALAFADAARKSNAVVVDAKNPNRAILLVGEKRRPLPVPLEKKNGSWAFSAKEGRGEILDRRIGSNESDAIQTCRGFVEAQEYAADIGAAGGRVIEERYTIDRKSAYHGYYFKVLKGQGPMAPVARLNYVIEGVMIGGVALIAVPAQYRVTGVKTFIVGYDGIVYQKDLGPTRSTSQRRWNSTIRTRAGSARTTSGRTRSRRARRDASRSDSFRLDLAQFPNPDISKADGRRRIAVRLQLDRRAVIRPIAGWPI